jgi:hypothetical protein
MDAALIEKRLKFAAARRLGAIPLAVVLLLGGLIAPLVTTSRFSELEENSPVKIRCEEFSLSHRISPQRQLRLETARVFGVHMIFSPRLLGHTQNPVLSAPRGHRLPNGLLAPITC